MIYRNSIDIVYFIGNQNQQNKVGALENGRIFLDAILKK